MSSALTYTRVALVTGGAQGIGRAVALRLAADGLDIAVDDIPSESQRLEEVVNEIRQMGRKAIALTCDVSKEDEVKSMVEQTVAQLGRLDAMIANAGISSYLGTVMDADVEKCEHTWSINMRGALLCYKYAAKEMVKQGNGGRIVGACSIAGLKGLANLSAYGMSKAAVRALTQTTALELAEHNITVNAYAPGIILTRMTVSEHDSAFGGEPGSAAKHALGSPNAKIGQPEDVASAISYLVSPEAHFITGQSGYLVIIRPVPITSLRPDYYHRRWYRFQLKCGFTLLRVHIIVAWRIVDDVETHHNSYHLQHHDHKLILHSSSALQLLGGLSQFWIHVVYCEILLSF